VSDVRIRPAVAADVPVVLELWRQAGSVPTRTDNEQAIERLLAHDASSLLIAEEDGAVVGTLIAAFDGWRGALYRLAVLPGRRRRGVAGALVSEGERLLRERGAARVSLYAVRTETGALDFWKTGGYRQDEYTWRFVKDLAP
jgi:ribosomal protein S18 acetylase RimI-like enzyme